MTFYSSDLKTGELSLNDSALKSYAQRELGEDFTKFKESQFLKSITDPKGYIADRQKFRENFFAEASDSFAKNYKRFYTDLGMPSEMAKEEALRLSRREMADSLSIVNSIYPSQLQSVAAQNVIAREQVSNPGRLDSDLIRNSEKSRATIKGQKRRKSSRKTKKSRK